MPGSHLAVIALNSQTAGVLAAHFGARPLHSPASRIAAGQQEDRMVPTEPAAPGVCFQIDKGIKRQRG